METDLISDKIQQQMHDQLPAKAINGLVTGSMDINIVRWQVKLHVFLLALKSYGSLAKAIKATWHFYNFRAKIFGKKGNRKFVKHDGKYFFALYVPGFPSSHFDNYIRHWMNEFMPVDGIVDSTTLLHLAMTCKCPMHCEHCFEWKNLNKPEPFSSEEISEMIRRYQQKGVSSIHLTGGEPMARFKELEKIISKAEKKSEFWVLSSGFNVTRDNSIRLKNSGTTGIIISLDHFDSLPHDIFRGYKGAFNLATGALKHAREAGLLTAVSICVSSSFITSENLMEYARLARTLGASFIQLLEPKPVGHYEGKNIMLDKSEIKLLEEFMYRLNYDKRYEDYPIVVYHGQYQRKSGCFSGGSRSLYIDSAGYAHSCPFCHSADYNIRDILNNTIKVPSFVSSCKVYDELK